MRAGALLVALPLALVLLGLAGTARAANGNGRPPPPPPDDLELGPAPFPIVDPGQESQRLRVLARIAEQESGLVGLADYLIATAWTESKHQRAVYNPDDDGLGLLCGSPYNYQKRFRKNPWLPGWQSETACRTGPNADRWAHSGGWFGLMPATALATWDGRANVHDPARIFDPAFSVAYATDLAYRLRRRNGAETWGDVRAGWAFPGWATEPANHPGKAAALERFRAALEMVGGPADLPNRPIRVGRYTGFAAVLAALMDADGRPLS